MSRSHWIVFVSALVLMVSGCGSSSNAEPQTTPDTAGMDVTNDVTPDVAQVSDTADVSTPDTGDELDATVPDVPDTAVDVPQPSGGACAPCETNDDCTDGVCVTSSDATIQYCTRNCLDGCPAGFGCETILQGTCTPNIVGGVSCKGEGVLLVENTCGHQLENPCPAGDACNPMVCQEFGTTANCVQAPSPDGSACKCDATCQDGVCGGGVEGDGDCVGIIGCISMFDKPEECLDVCTLAASPQAKLDFDEFTACIGGCGFAENIQTCVAEQCFKEMQQCMHAGLSGAESCSGIASCVEGCGGGQECGQTCIESGTMVAQEMFYLMQNCLIDACGTYPTTACADEASAGICATKINTCFEQ